MLLLFCTSRPPPPPHLSLYLNSHRAGTACDLRHSGLQSLTWSWIYFAGQEASTTPEQGGWSRSKALCKRGLCIGLCLPGLGVFFATNTFLSNSEGDLTEHIPCCSGEEKNQVVSKLGITRDGQLGMWISISTTLAALSQRLQLW